jgi:hypothetical protein
MNGTVEDGPIGNVDGYRLVPAAAIPGQSPSGDPLAWDYMSYRGGGFWTSVYSYCRLLRAISRGGTTCPGSLEGSNAAVDRDRPPRFASLDRTPDPASDAPSEFLGSLKVPELRTVQGLVLYVSGTLLPNAAIRLDPFEVRSVTSVPGPPQHSELSVALVDRQGLIFTEQQLEVDPPGVGSPRDPYPSLGRRFSGWIPWSPSAARVLIRSPNGVVAQRAVSASAPQVRITQAPTGELLGRQRLEWSGRDADGDPLTYSVWYTSDGNRWITIAQLVGEGALTLDSDVLPGGQRAGLRVLASDGVRTTAVEVPAFRVAAKPPRVVVSGIREGAVVPVGTAVLLRSDAYDMEDGALSDSAFIWTDSAGRRLGSGSWVALEPQEGGQVVTLTVRDRSGMSTSISRHFTVSRLPLPEHNE